MSPASLTLVAGVDSSTQSTKVVLRDLESGAVVAQASSPHPPTTPPVSEQEPGSWWAALTAAFDQLGAYRDQVAAISIAAQQHGLVLLDAHGAALRPAKLWNDTTSAEQSARLTATIGAKAWQQACGSVPVPAVTITKLAWVIDNEPDLGKQIAKIMLPHDYLTWRLTGEHVTDRGDASGTGWFDPTDNRYRSDLLGHAVDNPEQWVERLPRVLGPGEGAGTVTASAAEGLGLPAGIPVAAGTGDNMGAALGLGLRPGDTAISLGTSGTVYANSTSAPDDSSGAVSGFANATGGFLPLVCTLNATKVTDAVANWFGLSPNELSNLALEGAVTDVGAAPTAAPTLVPYLDGERTPNLPHASGQWVGLRTNTSRAQMARSAFDGVLCGLLDGMDALTQAGVATDGRILLIGGGAQSPAYRQRAADLSQRVVSVPTDDQLVATGAAVQAAALHAECSIDEIVNQWALDGGDTIDPDPDDAGTVRDAYRAARDKLITAEQSGA